ncbi:MAG: transposase [bacterium]
MTGLKRDFGIDYVTRARDERLEVVKYIEMCIEGGDVKWIWRREEHSQFGEIKVRSTGIEGIPLYDEKGNQIGLTNAVVSDERDIKGNSLHNEDSSIRRPVQYITSLPTIKNPFKIRNYYRSRWIIENQGFRELNQRWKIERLAGRKFNTINARITFALMLYNSEHIMKMRHPDAWQDQRYRLSGKWATGLGGLSIVVYTPKGGLGLFTTRQYGNLVKEAERNRIVNILESAEAHGQTIKEILALLHPKENR